MGKTKFNRTRDEYRIKRIQDAKEAARLAAIAAEKAREKKKQQSIAIGAVEAIALAFVPQLQEQTRDMLQTRAEWNRDGTPRQKANRKYHAAKGRPMLWERDKDTLSAEIDTTVKVYTPISDTLIIESEMLPPSIGKVKSAMVDRELPPVRPQYRKPKSASRVNDGGLTKGTAVTQYNTRLHINRDRPPTIDM